MRKAFFCLMLLGCLYLLHLPVNALTYLDQMDGSGSGARGSAEYLAPVMRSRSLEPTDRYQLQVMPGRDGKLRGSVQYLAQGVESIALRLYTPKGTYVSSSGGTLALGTDSGVFRPEPSAVSGAYYHTANGKLYAYHGGWQVFEQSPLTNYGDFQTVEEVEGAKLVPFGVCVYLSQDGGNKTLLALTRTSIQHLEVEGQLFCVEDFVCENLPSKTTSIWVELNDLEGNLLSPSVRTSLAWVKLQGVSLTVGPPRESSPNPGVTSSLPESPAANSSSKSSSKASSKSSAKASPPADGSSAADKKSGGSSVALKAESSKASSRSPQRKDSSPSASTSVTSQESTLSEPPRYLDGENDPLVYQVQIPPQDSGISWGVVSYIALVSGVIFYLLLRPRQK